MQRSAVQSIGQERLEAANHPRFHEGGLVAGRVPQVGAMGGKMVGNMSLKMMDSVGSMMMFDMVKRLKDGIQASAIDAAMAVGAPGKNANAAYPSAFWGFPPNIPMSRISAQGKAASVNKNSAPYFQGLLNDLTAQGYAINSLGGYANRGNTSDPSKLSQHAFGNAIDINPAQNPYGQKLITNMPGNIQSLIAKNRLYWGGNWQTVKDAMHFEWAGPMKKGGKIKHDNTLAALHRGETVLTEPLTAKLGDAIKMAARPQVMAGMPQAGPTKVDNSVYNISVMAKTDADANEIARHIFRIQKDAQAKQGWQS
jgi:hypothetical protein